MSDTGTYSSYAVLYELNKRELRKKIDLYPEDSRYYVILANSIIGAENAKRVQGTPEAVVRDGKEFVEKLAGLGDAGQDDSFRDIIETCLLETLKDELRNCCSNCLNFNVCLDPETLPVGHLFERRAKGEETPELKKEIELQIEEALRRTPYIETDHAHLSCKDFRHQYSPSTLGPVFGRYLDIAAELSNSFGIDYEKVQLGIIEINMEFCKTAGT